MRETIETRRRLKAMSRKQDFENLLDNSTLSDEDKEIMRLIYLKSKPLGFIADMLGYSETTIKRRHKNALKKLHNLL